MTGVPSDIAAAFEPVSYFFGSYATTNKDQVGFATGSSKISVILRYAGPAHVGDTIYIHGGQITRIMGVTFVVVGEFDVHVGEFKLVPPTISFSGTFCDIPDGRDNGKKIRLEDDHYGLLVKTRPSRRCGKIPEEEQKVLFCVIAFGCFSCQVRADDPTAS
ncbi:hypothetical protein BC828DRAFT_393427 [Blastocladiella britannica]|nr:hypothetical protein BC828DRAFT_393427 [Blastocladiella britannica]